MQLYDRHATISGLPSIFVGWSKFLTPEGLVGVNSNYLKFIVRTSLNMLSLIHVWYSMRHFIYFIKQEISKNIEKLRGSAKFWKFLIAIQWKS